jgi:parvulin-like peptidyl-prolyl isomerase
VAPPAAPPPAAAVEDAPRDPAVQSAAGDPTAVRSNLPPRSVFQAGQIAAWVGDEVITLQEVTTAVTQRRKALPPGQRLTREEGYYLAKSVLNDLVDRTLVLQEVKRQLKKNYKSVTDGADKAWLEEELPPLLRQHAAANIYELKRKMTEKGESLDEQREAFRLNYIYQGFLMHTLGPKLTVELPEMIAYYNAHLKGFDRPAQVTWREVLVEVGRQGDRDAARRKAEAALARLRRGDGFAAVARAESDGPNKAEGGLWQTTPGGYGVAAVNAALGSLRTGELSGVLEGPSSFHVVRVEARRAAGPASFAEVQDQIKKAIHDEKVRRESTAYLEKLRQRTLVSTVFDAKPNLGVTRASATVTTPRRPAGK